MRKQFVQLVNDPKHNAVLNQGGKTILIKNDRAEMQNERNMYLREAGNLIKASTLSNGKVVEIDWMVEPRVVKADGVIGFSRTKSDLMGTFMGVYNDLTFG